VNELAIPTRVAMQEALAAARSYAARYHHRYAVALCDIDAFAAYTRANGATESNQTLRRVAEGIRSQLRRGDMVYRYAGAELLVLLPEQTVSGAATAIERVRSGIEGMAIASNATAANVITISAGIAALSSNDHSIDDWFQRARAALQRAKYKGYNRIELAS
jgi:diguanylate cyclase (GGDEF)-like protein